MDSFLDRYISYEYLVSPCPQAGRSAAEPSALQDARAAVERARECVEVLRNSGQQDERSSSVIGVIEKELQEASALLDSAANKPWLS